MRKLIRKFLNWVWEDRHLENIKHHPELASAVRNTNLNHNNVLRFNVHRANNGYILEVNQYDRTADREYNCLHIITEEQDLGVEIAHIITLESFKMAH